MVSIPKLEPRLLVLDIETSKTIFATYPGKKPQYLSHKDIIQDWFIICAAWKWIGHKQLFTTSLLDDPDRYKKSPIDDLHVVRVLHEILSKADAVIGHNVDKFDWGKILERIIYYGLDPISKPKMIDTMKMAKQAHFSYNNLDYLCKRLETSSQKRENGGNEMWMDIVQGGCPERIKECVEYCKGDVPTAEELYLRIAPYMPSKMLLNRNVWRDADKQGCPYCASLNYVIDNKRKTLTGISTSYRCKECAHIFTDGKTVMKTKDK